LPAADLDALVAFVLALAPTPAAGEPLPDRVRAALVKAGFTPAGDLRPAPPLAVHDAEGHPRSLADFRGRLVLLTFWGTACAPCLAELPALERLAGECRGQGLSVVCVCADETDPDRVRAVTTRHSRGLPVFVDPSGSTRRRYDVQLLPAA